MPASNYELALVETLAFLAVPRTASEVALRFGISKVSAYARLNALATRKKVALVEQLKGPRGKTGPKPIFWKAA